MKMSPIQRAVRTVEKNMKKMMIEDHHPRKQSSRARPTLRNVIVNRKKRTPRQTLPADLTDLVASSSLNCRTEKKRDRALMAMLAS